jgi:KipI family sensor histidine kinase inhibitor
MKAPRYLPAGDAALVVEFGDRIDEAVSRRVISLARDLMRDPTPGLSEVVPTYRSLLIHYDPLQSSHQEMVDLVQARVRKSKIPQSSSSRVVELPTAYGGAYGPDIAYVADYHDLSVEDVIRIHSERDYYVYMLGFTPGFPYLGGLDAAIATPRLETPRTDVAAGSVGIGGHQTGVYSVASPGGWCIIGRTPAVLFDAQRDPPALLRPGDQVRFVPIPAEEFEDGVGDH